VFVQVCAFTQQELLPLGNINPGFNYIRLTRDGCPNTLLGCNQVCKGPTHYSPAVVIDRFCALAGALARDFPTRMASILRDDYDTHIRQPAAERPPGHKPIGSAFCRTKTKARKARRIVTALAKMCQLATTGRAQSQPAGHGQSWPLPATGAPMLSRTLGSMSRVPTTLPRRRRTRRTSPARHPQPLQLAMTGVAVVYQGCAVSLRIRSPLVSSGEPRGPKRSFVGGPASLRTSPPCKRRKVGTLRPQADRPDARRQ
jgi:hypothetical protein